MVHQGVQSALISVTQCLDLNCGSKNHFAKKHLTALQLIPRNSILYVLLSDNHFQTISNTVVLQINANL